MVTLFLAMQCIFYKTNSYTVLLSECRVVSDQARGDNTEANTKSGISSEDKTYKRRYDEMSHLSDKKLWIEPRNHRNEAKSKEKKSYTYAISCASIIA